MVRNALVRQNRLPARVKFRLAGGKFRRFLLGMFGKNYVEFMTEKRHGECVRCGTCCKLLFDCPYLSFDENGLACCEIHEHKPINCRIFPSTPDDIAERNLLDGSSRCGYSFDDEAQDPKCRISVWRAIVASKRKLNRKSK